MLSTTIFFFAAFAMKPRDFSLKTRTLSPQTGTESR